MAMILTNTHMKKQTSSQSRAKVCFLNEDANAILHFSANGALQRHSPHSPFHTQSRHTVGLGIVEKVHFGGAEFSGDIVDLGLVG